MEDVKEKIKNIHHTTLCSANIVECAAGTTGFRGGDSGHGGRTYFSLKDLGGTDMRAKVKKETLFGYEVIDVNASEIEIGFGGDCELRTFMEALEFALNIYKKEIEENETLQ